MHFSAIFSGIIHRKVSKTIDKGACSLTSRNTIVSNEREGRNESNEHLRTITYIAYMSTKMLI